MDDVGVHEGAALQGAVAAQESWGHFAPPLASFPLLALIKFGLSRGAFRKTILRRWQNRFGDNVDIQKRGIHYRLNLEDNVTDSKIFASSNIYDKAELGHLIKAAKNGLFVDIGANTGYYSLTLSQQAKCQVIAIEPNFVTLQRLRFNIALNPSLSERIKVIACGVGPKGRANLFYGDNLGAASLMTELVPATKTNVTIEMRPLYQILQDQNIIHIDALKIDIEGAEDQALIPFFKTAPKNLWPNCLVLEWAHQKTWEEDLMSCLVHCGYKVKYKGHGNIIMRL